jgi:hypothetical protein
MKKVYLKVIFYLSFVVFVAFLPQLTLSKYKTVMDLSGANGSATVAKWSVDEGKLITGKANLTEMYPKGYYDVTFDFPGATSGTEVASKITNINLNITDNEGVGIGSVLTKELRVLRYNEQTGKYEIDKKISPDGIIDASGGDQNSVNLDEAKINEYGISTKDKVHLRLWWRLSNDHNLEDTQIADNCNLKEGNPIEVTVTCTAGLEQVD